MDLQLTGKRALVTGGSRGIGRAIARALALEGATVVIAARNDRALLAAASELTTETGGRVVAVPADTGDQGSVDRLVAAALDEMSGVDILVNAAANPWNSDQPKNFQSITDDLIRAELEIKVLGYLRTARAVAPHLVANGWGRIINISGLGARQAGSAAHTIRNVSVSALTKNLADELGPLGINVTVVHPGVTRTEKLRDLLATRSLAEGRSIADLERELATNSVSRLIDAAEVADVVAFLASPRSIAINGDAVAVGGGVPGPIYY